MPTLDTPRCLSGENPFIIINGNPGDSAEFSGIDQLDSRIKAASPAELTAIRSASEVERGPCPCRHINKKEGYFQ
jgi:hypothetical protein